jgi:preprotein translocase subunit SecG
MNFLVALLIVVEVICCLMLIGLVLLQKSKSEGLGMAFGAGAGESLFGARAGNVLSKATVVLGIVFLANTLVLGVLFAQNENESSIGKQLQQSAGPVPAQPADEADFVIPEVTPAAEVPAAEVPAAEVPAADAQDDM